VVDALDHSTRRPRRARGAGAAETRARRRREGL